MNKNTLLKKIKSGEKIIAVYGLGNVGGPIAAAWLRKGAKIIGVDISQNLLNKIEKGISHKVEPHISNTFSKALKSNKLSLTFDGIDASKKSNIKFVAVPVHIGHYAFHWQFLDCPVFFYRPSISDLG